jgi:DNA-binding IclR family transcriptional regulator
VGKALLAWQTPPALEVYLPGNVNRLRRISPRTITDRASLLSKLEEVRRQGYAVDDQECRLGWRCVGAPIFDQWGSTRVAICLTGTVEELDTERLTPTASAVMETAHKISQRLAMEHVEFATY